MKFTDIGFYCIINFYMSNIAPRLYKDYKDHFMFIEF